MESDVMTHVDEQGATSPYPTGKGDGIVDELMGVMGLHEAQGIDHQDLRAFKIWQFALVDGLHIGDIGERPHAIAQDGQFAVHHLEGHDLEVANLQGHMGQDLMQADGRDTRIAVLRKTVGQHLEHRCLGMRVGIDIDLAELTVRADVVHASHVVVVAVSDQDTVDLTEGLREDLLSEVGTTVDENAGGLRLYQGGATGTFVARILAPAYLALATDHGNTAGGAGSEKRQFHLQFDNFQFTIDWAIW